MPINPLAPSASPGTPAGLAVRMADLDRRLRSIRTVINDGSIVGTMVAPSSITTSHIVAGSIDASLIAANAITASAIAANAVTAAAIAAGTITSDKLYSGTVQASLIQSANISAGAITAATIAAGTITATQIASGTITSDKLYSGAIQSNLIQAANIAAGTITATNIAAGTITSTLLASGAVLAGNIATGAVTSDKISVTDLSAVSATLGTITLGTSGKLRTAVSGARVEMGANISTTAGTINGLVGVDSSNAVTFSIDATTGAVQLKGQVLAGSSGLGNISGSINGGTQINAASVTGDRLVIDTITAREIASGVITAVEIASNTIIAGNIASGTITSTQIAAGTITGTNIAAGTITAANIAAGSITADRITALGGGRNLLLDSSFEDPNNPYWTSSLPLSANTNRTYIRSGNRSIRLVGNGTNNFNLTTSQKIRLVPGVTYTLSGYFWANIMARNVYPFLYGFDDANSPTATINPTGSIASTPEGATWTRVAVTFTYDPSNTAIWGTGTTQVSPAFNCTVVPVNTEDHYVDDIQFEAGGIPTDWKPYIDPTVIDGSTITAPVIRSSASNPRVQLDSTGLSVTDASANKLVTIDSTNGITVNAPTSLAGLSSVQALGWKTSAGEIFGQIFGYGAISDQRRGALKVWGKSNSGDTTLGTAGASLEAEHVYDTALNNHRKALLGVETGIEGSASNSRIWYSLSNSGNVSSKNTLIDALGQSKFLQASSVLKSVAAWGEVGSTGTIAQAGSGDWSVVRNAVGTYSVTINTTSSSDFYIPLIVPYGPPSMVGWWLSAIGTTGFQVNFRPVSTPAGANVDSSFVFFALVKP